MEELVKTINGEYRKKEECRYVDKEYHIIGNVNIENSGDIYLINDRYIRVSTGKLIFNHTIKQYQLKNMSVIEGIIGFNDCEPIIGYFDNDNINNVNVTLKNKMTYKCINENVINLNFRERRSSGSFFHISLLSTKEFNKIPKVSREYKESLSYDSKNVLAGYINTYNNNYNPVINKDINEYSKVLNGLSFGLEFETIMGQIPKHKINYLPLIPLRDGSISGLEYVTIPLEGSKGIHALIDSVKELRKRTEYDTSCSLHLHIGNVPRTPEFILAFYKLVSYFQDDLFNMFPLYKKYNFGVKKKNYSKPFPINKINFNMDKSIDINDKKSVNSNFKVLFDYLSMGSEYENYDCDLKNVNYHPADQMGNQKWNIRTRYYAINFIPLIFGNKSTIEFRIHTPTYSINKIINFLFFNAILINYTKSHMKEILYSNNEFIHNNLNNIIANFIQYESNVSKNNRNKLISEMDRYIVSRKNFTFDNNCKGDIKGDEDKFRYFSTINYERLVNSKNEILDDDNYKIIEPLRGNGWDIQENERPRSEKQKDVSKYYVTNAIGINPITNITEIVYYDRDGRKIPKELARKYNELYRIENENKIQKNISQYLDTQLPDYFKPNIEFKSEQPVSINKPQPLKSSWWNSKHSDNESK